jgi:hypothetical protein
MGEALGTVEQRRTFHEIRRLQGQGLPAGPLGVAAQIPMERARQPSKPPCNSASEDDFSVYRPFGNFLHKNDISFYLII